MGQAQNSPGRYPKERRYRRFNLQFPVCLTFPSAGAVHELVGVSKNVSIGGLLLSAGDRVPPHTLVTLTMDVRGPWSRHPTRLVGNGEVVRVENLGSGSGFAIAIECNQTITEMKDCLSAAGQRRRTSPAVT
jgi:hypothetical protein